MRMMAAMHALGLLGAMALAASASLAQEGDPAPSGSGVGPGDLIQIQIHVEEGVTGLLSGQFEIDAQGAIDYPVLGRFPVADMEISEIGEALRLALVDQVPMTGTPAVSVVRYAPVYLLGHAQKTGPIEFTPGMTVFDLILSTGGLPQPGMDQATLLATTQEVADLAVLVHSLQVRLARLRAQNDGGEFDGKIDSDIPGADRIVSGEAAILQASRHAQASQASDYKMQIERYDQEIASLHQTIVLHDSELALLEEEVAGIQKLSDSGLTSKARLSDLKRELAGMQRQALEFRTSLYRVEQEKLSLGERFSQAKLMRDIQNLELLRDTGVELTRAELRLKAARDLLPTLEASPEVAKSLFMHDAEYTVVRTTDGSTQVLAAETSTKLARGDIVRVDVAARQALKAADGTEPEDEELAVAPQAGELR